jgi:hypothetical protein
MATQAMLESYTHKDSLLLVNYFLWCDAFWFGLQCALGSGRVHNALTHVCCVRSWRLSHVRSLFEHGLRRRCVRVIDTRIVYFRTMSSLGIDLYTRIRIQLLVDVVLLLYACEYCFVVWSIESPSECAHGYDIQAFRKMDCMSCWDALVAYV